MFLANERKFPPFVLSSACDSKRLQLEVLLVKEMCTLNNDHELITSQKCFYQWKTATRNQPNQLILAGSTRLTLDSFKRVNVLL